MSEYNEGDLVEAEKKEIASSTRFRGLVEVVQSNVGTKSYLAAQGYSPEIAWLEEQGFTLTVIEKAKPKLPEEPGVYITAATEPDVFQLLSDGTWWLGDERVMAEQVRHDGGNSLTKLEPVAETAKKVLERFQEVHAGAFVTVEEVAAQLAAEFGAAK